VNALLAPGEIRELARRLDVRPSKRLGQNFVTDAGTVRRIVSLAELQPDDVVLEVGPGFGSLTLGLLPVARQVITIEVDPSLAAALPVTVAAHAPSFPQRLTVVTADAARIGAAELPGDPPTALVANLPYNVAVPVVLHLLAELPSLRRGLVLSDGSLKPFFTRPISIGFAAPGLHDQIFRQQSCGSRASTLSTV